MGINQHVWKLILNPVTNISAQTVWQLMLMKYYQQFIDTRIVMSLFFYGDGDSNGNKKKVAVDSNSNNNKSTTIFLLLDSSRTYECMAITSGVSEW